MSERFAKLPHGPCYAVIFSSQRREGDNGYAEMAERMDTLVNAMPGFLGYESARDAEGFGITVAYFDSEDAIRNWKRQTEHRDAQRLRREKWYDHYQVRVAKVERAYAMTKNQE